MMSFLRYQLTGVIAGTDEVVFSGIIATWHLAEILSKADDKYGLSVQWSLVPVHLNSLPDKRHEVNKL